jgi:HD superfamily phosphodiesterase
MSQELMNLLTSQHKRLVATVMRHIERDVYPALSLEQRRDLREVVVRAAGVYHDTALDCLKAVASDDTVVTNERLYDLLEQIHRAVYVPKGRT